jgi:hypothetical protein
MPCCSPTRLLDPSQLDAPAGGAAWPRTRHQRPLVIPEAGGKPRAYTRTTTLAGVLSDESGLVKWRDRTLMYGVAHNPRVAEAARYLDPASPEGKRELARLANRAFVLGGGEAKSAKGTWLHHLSEHVDRGEELPPCSEADRADMDAYRRAVEPLTMRAIEQPIVTIEVEAAGTADRIASTTMRTPDGDEAGAVIVDLKTGSLDHAGLKIACQLAAYAHGQLYDPTLWITDPGDDAALQRWKAFEFTAAQGAVAYQEYPNLNRRWGLVVHVPAGSGEAALVWVDLARGWAALQDATRVRTWRATRDLLVPAIAHR